MKYIKIFSFLAFLFCSTAYAKWITGVGYFLPGEYRVDNEISPLPLGWNIVPMIGYVSPKLRVIGPRVSYRAFGKGPYALRVNINATGDRYRSHEISTRDSAIDVGASLRLLFLKIHYASDISNVYHGNSYGLELSWRFLPTDSFFIIPSLSLRFVNSGYTNYYYGVKESEVGFFSAYEVDASRISTLRVTCTYKLNEQHAIAFTINRRAFADEIYDSPTVNKKSYYSSSLFWNYTL